MRPERRQQQDIARREVICEAMHDRRIAGMEIRIFAYQVVRGWEVIIHRVPDWACPLEARVESRAGCHKFAVVRQITDTRPNRGGHTVLIA